MRCPAQAPSASPWRTSRLPACGGSGMRTPKGAFAAPSGAQERQDGQHAAVGVAGVGQAELREDARDVLLDAALADPEAIGDPLVRAPLRHQRQNLTLAVAEGLERVVRATAAEELGDDRRLEDGPPATHASDRLGEHL